jgi:hypothetical protein
MDCDTVTRYSDYRPDEGAIAIVEAVAAAPWLERPVRD